MARLLALLLPSLVETLIMVGISFTLSLLFGILLGTLLVATKKGGVEEKPLLYLFLSRIIDAVRSIPFIVLLLFLFPVTKWITGTSIGIKAALVPLVVAAIPFYARLTESALLDVPPGIQEAAQSMGASSKEILLVMLSEAKAPLIRAATNLMINLIGYSAMAGAIGAGGLGDLAIRYGHQRYQFHVMLATVILLYLLVSLLQHLGYTLASAVERK